MTMGDSDVRQRHCLGSTSSCGACGTEWARCPLSASSPCSVEVSDWSAWLPTQTGDAFRFRCWVSTSAKQDCYSGIERGRKTTISPQISISLFSITT
ncbi:hypothetical protein PENTCL1PPCAC_11637 [Pristionchus entomophagus]|uniref:Uncharacterized protein n=1 Tax=Pristionchus entomophagus TaxID=358040 RepID=A0AAV5T4M8_9BILA|nr:hypothetical protein PENTCL1PPCAC_11637 [Pristionchus entomophagus]